VRVRVFGPLEVDGDDGRPAALGGRQAHALLGLLTLDANRVVPVRRLIDELWGDDPPASARKTVQTYVSRLRNVLGKERLQSSADGYRLVAGDAGLYEDAYGSRMHPVERARYSHLLGEAQSEPAFVTAYERGRELTLERALEYALQTAEDHDVVDVPGTPSV
jgi:DNA-binding SARP family transcriptional activator